MQRFQANLGIINLAKSKELPCAIGRWCCLQCFGDTIRVIDFLYRLDRLAFGHAGFAVVIKAHKQRTSA